MYLIIKEIVEFINFFEEYVYNFVLMNKIRVVYDG